MAATLLQGKLLQVALASPLLLQQVLQVFYGEGMWDRSAEQLTP